MDPIVLLPLPEDYRVNLLRRLPVQVPEVPELRRRIAETVRRAHEQAGSLGTIDVACADKIGRELQWMLDEMGHAWNGENLALVAAAVDYFADDDDLEPDFGGAFGFDDDAEVVDAVRRILFAQGI